MQCAAGLCLVRGWLAQHQRNALAGCHYLIALIECGVLKDDNAVGGA
jgi:hypothetical protein